MSNKDLSKTAPHLRDFLPFLEIQRAESPRGAVLVACSFLEEQLRRIIDAFLLEDSDKEALLIGFNAPLGTFSARIKAAHGLGLITDPERDDCDTLRKIRNEFAHNYRVTFESQKLIDLCRSLHHSAKDYGDVVVGTQGQFTTGAVGLIVNLINRPHYVSRHRCTKVEWPR